MKIPIVYATDTNYLFYTCVSIASAAQNADEKTFYQVYILSDRGMEDEYKLLDKLQKIYANIHIDVIVVDEDIFHNVIINNTHVTRATFYRLVICNLISEEKCIYLDADTIITEDLEELYKTDLEGYFIAGCRDIWIDLLTDEAREFRRLKTELHSMDQYVNAGVLVFNLKKIRKDDATDFFLSHLDKGYPYEDQDILNVCCYNHIKRLPAKWNLFTLFMGQIGIMREAGLEEPILSAFKEKKGIIHYATPFIRPWERESCWANRQWWQAAQIWIEEPIYGAIKQCVEDNERKQSWDYYVEACCSYRCIVIFGYTKHAEEFSEWVKKIIGRGKIVFCDNDVEKQGIVFKGIPVKSFAEVMSEEAVSTHDDILFIVASQGRVGQICCFLEEQGISENQIICYKRKNSDYYTYLDQRYYMREVLDICKKEGKNEKEFFGLSLDAIKKKIIGEKQYSGWIEKYFLKNWLLEV